jgi:hypothetical protein
MRLKKVATVAGTLTLVSTLTVSGYVYRKPIALSARNAKAWFLNEKVASPAAAPIADHSQHRAADHRQVAYWYDAMNPNYKSDKPGTAPDGMQLVPMYQDELEKMKDMPPGTVMLTPDKQQLIGVRTGEVQLADMSRTLRTVGRVEADQTKIAHIHAKFQGWIDEVYVDFVGKLVPQGPAFVQHL